MKIKLTTEDEKDVRDLNAIASTLPSEVDNITAVEKLLKRYIKDLSKEKRREEALKQLIIED